MRIEDDMVITLNSGRKYAFLNDVIYEEERYLMLMGVTEDEENVLEEDMIVVKEVKDGDVYKIEPLTNFELLIRITKMLKEGLDNK